MPGASARYSCLHAPVETVTPPRRQTKPIPFRFRGFRRSPESSISIGSVFLSNLNQLALGFKLVKNGRTAVSVFLSNSGPLALGSELAENDRCSTDDSCLPLSLEVNASRPNRTMGTIDDKLNYSLTGSG